MTAPNYRVDLYASEADCVTPTGNVLMHVWIGAPSSGVAAAAAQKLAETFASIFSYDYAIVGQAVAL